MKSVSFLFVILFLGSCNVLLMRGDAAGHVNVTARGPLPKACDVDGYSDWYRVGKTCIKYFNKPLNFSDAELDCRSKAPGGHLVSVHDDGANDALLCIVQKFNQKDLRIWIGGFELFKAGKFVWTDGSFWNYQIWTSGEPNNMYTSTEECVEMNWKEVGKWNDDSCLVKKNFICSFKRKRSFDE